MGTVLDKLSYLKETKESIKNAIVEVGGQVSDEDAFSDYAHKIMNCATIKKLLDATKKTDSFFSNYSGESVDEFIPNPSFTSSVTRMDFMFGNCTNLTSIPLMDTSSVTNMSSMFNNCKNLTSIPLMDTSSVTRMDYMFSNCTNLTSIPLMDTGSVTNMGSMFSNCTNLTSIPLMDTSSVHHMDYMFSNCTNLTSIPLMDTSSVHHMDYMFSNCTNLTSIPLMDTSSVTRMGYMFNNCKNLTSIPLLDIRSATNATKMFNGCSKLTDCYIRNIKFGSLTVGSGTSYGHLLTLESLVHLANELVKSSNNATRVLTIGSANLAKIKSVYVKLIDITDEMRAEDGLVDSKLPCVVCESTDEGSMLLSEYALLKKWTLK